MQFGKGIQIQHVYSTLSYPSSHSQKQKTDSTYRERSRSRNRSKDNSTNNSRNCRSNLYGSLRPNLHPPIRRVDLDQPPNLLFSECRCIFPHMNPSFSTSCNNCFNKQHISFNRYSVEWFKIFFYIDKTTNKFIFTGEQIEDSCILKIGVLNWSIASGGCFIWLYKTCKKFLRSQKIFILDICENKLFFNYRYDLMLYERLILQTPESNYLLLITNKIDIINDNNKQTDKLDEIKLNEGETTKSDERSVSNNENNSKNVDVDELLNGMQNTMKQLIWYFHNKNEKEIETMTIKQLTNDKTNLQNIISQHGKINLQMNELEELLIKYNDNINSCLAQIIKS